MCHHPQLTIERLEPHQIILWIFINIAIIISSLISTCNTMTDTHLNSWTICCLEIPSTLWFGILSSHQIKHSVTAWAAVFTVRERRAAVIDMRAQTTWRNQREKREACQLNHGVSNILQAQSCVCLLSTYLHDRGTFAN